MNENKRWANSKDEIISRGYSELEEMIKAELDVRSIYGVALLNPGPNYTTSAVFGRGGAASAALIAANQSIQSMSIEESDRLLNAPITKQTIAFYHIDHDDIVELNLDASKYCVEAGDLVPAIIKRVPCQGAYADLTVFIVSCGGSEGFKFFGRKFLGRLKR